MVITKDLEYVGVEDTKIDLFEGQYPVPHGITYNSYIIKDKEITVMDGVDARFADVWLNGIIQMMHGKSPSYIVVQHMEPDHSASVEMFMHNYPEAKLVATTQALRMAENLFHEKFAGRTVAVKDGDKLVIGRHTLHFISAPMVHWPEVIMTYDDYDNTLFSADAFGKFGPFMGDEVWTNEARRYYYGIVGKFGIPVQALLKKITRYPVAMICPLHGPIIKETVDYCVDLYKKWSTYTPERDGVTIVYASVYGNMKEAAEELARQLERKGQRNIVIYDIARTDMTMVLAEAFRFSKLVLCSPTINAGVFPAMKTFITALTDHNFQNRFVAFMECGMWSPSSGKCMADLLRGCKGVKYDDTRIRFLGRPDEATYEKIAELAAEISGK